jgi:hypothetical protein
MVFTVQSPVALRNARLRLWLSGEDASGSSQTCLIACSSAFDLTAGESFQVGVVDFVPPNACAVGGPGSCATPTFITSMKVENMNGVGPTFFQQFFSIFYFFDH